MSDNNNRNDDKDVAANLSSLPEPSNSENVEQGAIAVQQEVTNFPSNMIDGDNVGGSTQMNGLEIAGNGDESADPDQSRHFKIDEGPEMINDGDTPDQRHGNTLNESLQDLSHVKKEKVLARADVNLEVIEDGDSPDQRHDISSSQAGSRTISTSTPEVITDENNPDRRIKNQSYHKENVKIEGKPLLSMDPENTAKTSSVNKAIGPNVNNSASKSLPGATSANRNFVSKSSMAHISRYYTSTSNTSSSNARNRNRMIASMDAPPASTSALPNANDTQQETAMDTASQVMNLENAAVNHSINQTILDLSSSNPDPSSDVILEATLIEEPIRATVVPRGKHIYYEDEDEDENEGGNEHQHNEEDGITNNISMGDNDHKRTNTQSSGWNKRKVFIGGLLLLTLAVTSAIILTLVISNNDNSDDPTNSPSDTLEVTINATVDTIDDNGALDTNIDVNMSDAPSQSPQETTIPTSTTATTVDTTDDNGDLDTNIDTTMSDAPSQSPQETTIPTATTATTENLFAKNQTDNDSTNDINFEENGNTTNDNIFSNEEECTLANVHFTKRISDDIMTDDNNGNGNNEILCDRCNPILEIDGENAVITIHNRFHFFRLVPSINNNTSEPNTNKYEWELQSTIINEEYHSPYYFPVISGDLAIIGSFSEVNFIDGLLVRSGAVLVFELLSDDIDIVEGTSNETNDKKEKKTWRQTAKLVPEDPTAGSLFGRSVSVLSNIIISPSRNDTNVSYSDVIVVGAPADRGKIGSAYIFRRIKSSSSTGEWFQEAKLAPNDPDLTVFGFEVEIYQTVDSHNKSISNHHIDHQSNANEIASDGEANIKRTIVAVGDYLYGHFDDGTVFFYQYHDEDDGGTIDEGIAMNTGTSTTNGGTWKQWGPNMLNPDCYATFGASVKFNDVDQSLAIGCFYDDNGIGSVYYYAYNQSITTTSLNNSMTSWNNGVYQVQQKIVASDGIPGDIFSHYGQLDVQGNLMVVGAGDANETIGKTYVFVRQTDDEAGGEDGLIWKEVEIFRPPENDFYLGHWVAVHGNQILVSGANNVYSYEVNYCEKDS